MSDSDLRALVGLVAAFTVVLAIPGQLGVVQLALGLPFLLFAPGYAVLAAVYPRSSGGAATGRESDALTPVERTVLSVVVSVGVVAAVGVAANATLSVTPLPIAAGVGAVTLGAAAVARRKRAATIGDPGPEFPSRQAIANHLRPRSTVTTALNVLLVVSLVTAAAVVVATPDPGGETFTEFAMLGEGENGLSATALPTEYTVGEPRSVHLRVSNHEGVPVEYTAVMLLGTPGDESATVELDRTQVTVAAGETRTVERAVRPTRSGDPLRLTVLLYRGDPPASPSGASADRTLRLWVSVSESG